MKEEDEIRKMRKEIKRMRDFLKDVAYVAFGTLLLFTYFIIIEDLLMAHGLIFIIDFIGLIILIIATIISFLGIKYNVYDIKIKSKIKIIKLYDD